jgi:hypothetical protein
LDTRPYIEILQQKVMPHWLLNGDYLSSVKWAIALEFRLTPTAKVLCQRLENMSAPITIDELACAFASVYDAFSETVSHSKKQRPIRLSEQDWALLFEDAGLHDEPERMAVREMLQPVEVNEYGTVVYIAYQYR